MKRRALLVGVSTSRAGNLRGPDDDVEAVIETICEPRGLTHVVLANQHATRDGILDAIRSLVDGAAPDDALLFYFAGHGTRIIGDREQDTLNEALCPSDFDLADVRRAIRDFELHALFGRAQDRGAQLTVVLDCCFSAGLSEQDRSTAAVRGLDVVSPRDVASSGERARSTITRMIDLSRDRGRPAAVFAACQAHERAWEETHGRKVLGVFTRHFTSAARGVDLSNGDLIARVSTSLLAEHRPAERRQTPDFAPHALRSATFLGVGGGDHGTAAPGGPPSAGRGPRRRSDAIHPAVAFERPLRTYLCWARGDTNQVRETAVDLYEFLARDIEAQAVVRPSLSIPTEVGRGVGDLLEKLRDGREPFATRYAVLALLGEKGFGDADFRGKIGDLVQLANRRSDVEVLPIVADWRWSERLRRPPIATLRGGGEPRQRWQLAARIGLALGASMRGEAERGRSDAPLRVFIAMTRAEAGPPALEELIAAFDELGLHPTPTSTGIHRAKEIAAQLAGAGDAAVLVVVRTDHLSESPACTQAILAAKRQRIPILTVLATANGEVRAPTYGGNHRTIPWQPGRQWEIVARCVQAWLNHHHFSRFGRAALHLAGLPADSTVLSRAPELVDLRPDLRGLVVYPDPPLSDDERTTLADHRPDLRVATPNTLFGRVLMDGDPAPPLTGTRIALSLSDATDLPSLRSVEVGRGLGREHLAEVLDAIVLSTIQSGASIDYGGDFRAGGFAVQLSDRIVAYRRLGLTPDEEVSGSRATRACLHCYAREGTRDGAGTPVYEPIEVALPAGHQVCDVDHHEALWHLAMRHEVSRNTHARVLLGAALRSHHVEPSGYRGAWPGVLEEAYRTIQADGALFVVGGFGGCAGAISQMLASGEVPPEFRSEALDASPAHAAQVSAFAEARLAAAAQPGADVSVLAVRDGRALGAEDFAAALLSSWQRFVDLGRDPRSGAPTPRWTNGLDEAENLRLFSSTDPTEISHLVFAGLVRARGDRTQRVALQLRCYHGDIGAVPEIDAYAVSVTPGLEPLGASASLDRRCGGRVRRAVLGGSTDAIEIGTSALAGRYVLGATLRLPASPSERVDPADIARLAADIGHKCGRLGLDSIACTPFGASLDVAVEDSVRAMLRGFRDAGTPRVVTFCEVDEVRHRLLRQALAHETFEELHEGPTVPPASDALLLVVEAEPPTADQPGRVRSMLHHPGLLATVPSGEQPVDRARWERLRSKPTDWTEIVAQAQDLRALLPATLAVALDGHGDATLSVVVERGAAGLPWELLGCDARDGSPRRGCVTRRIRLQTADESIASSVRGNRRLRVLLVADPTDDLPAATRERDRIVEILRHGDRADVTCISGRDATLRRIATELERCEFDVLHYAGHGSFDATNRERCGLVLADGLFTSADLPDAPVPALVVLAACDSSQILGAEDRPMSEFAEAAWSIAEGILRRGVRAFVGAGHRVGDEAARDFVTHLYRHLVAGHQLGEAVRNARERLHRSGQMDWVTFQVYGDLGLTL